MNHASLLIRGVAAFVLAFGAPAAPAAPPKGMAAPPASAAPEHNHPHGLAMTDQGAGAHKGMPAHKAMAADEGMMPGGTEAPVAQPVHINRADAKTLQTLYGVGPYRARAILLQRKLRGPFRSEQDLMKIRGLAKDFLQRNRDRIRWD